MAAWPPGRLAAWPLGRLAAPERAYWNITGRRVAEPPSAGAVSGAQS